jgi:hypothetical protein
MKRFLLACLLATAIPASAQTVGTGDPAAGIAWSPISMAGIPRANRLVESVFITRETREQLVSGGDWVSYMAARLGAVPIPDQTGIRVAVDSQRILVDGRMVDLPPETRALFGPIAMLVDSNTVLRAEVRFVLATISVNGFQIPESILSSFLARVGQQYPALTKTGRELLVAVPPDGKVSLANNAVRVWIDESLSASGSPPR